MFIIMYRGQVKPDCEDKYQKAWRICANYFVKSCGALGSKLYQTEKGEWVAISQWPDRATRDKVWENPQALPVEIQEAVANLKASLLDFTEIELKLVDAIEK